MDGGYSRSYAIASAPGALGSQVRVAEHAEHEEVNEIQTQVTSNYYDITFEIYTRNASV